MSIGAQRPSVLERVLDRVKELTEIEDGAFYGLHLLRTIGIAGKRSATPFRALSNIPCGLVDTCCHMGSLNFSNYGGLSSYTLDFKNPQNQTSQGGRSRRPYVGKVLSGTRSFSNVERGGGIWQHCSDTAVCGGMPSCIKVAVCCGVLVVLQFWNDIVL
ncbi:hypothetical protein AVEN_124074-1 [Araneus ventricosus]|uniref:Uncharacterized protein n=1 Tax=Araneus ventricosus TaxID=182803 RepID=A0A4Y2QP24_ARAVE|nr:hypothetical protein AVEN_124074-1 [Araneus ventricosus]